MVNRVWQSIDAILEDFSVKQQQKQQQQQLFDSTLLIYILSFFIVPKSKVMWHV